MELPELNHSQRRVLLRLYRERRLKATVLSPPTTLMALARRGYAKRTSLGFEVTELGISRARELLHSLIVKRKEAP